MIYNLFNNRDFLRFILGAYLWLLSNFLVWSYILWRVFKFNVIDDCWQFIDQLCGFFRRRSHVGDRRCFLSDCVMVSGDIVRMFVFGLNRRHSVSGCCGLDAIKAFVNGQCRGTDRRCGFGDRCRRFFTRLLVVGLRRGQNDGCVPRLSCVDPQLFSALFQNSQISVSSFGGSAPKKRSSAARSRKYSATVFIMSKEFSNPSNVHENVQ